VTIPDCGSGSRLNVSKAAQIIKGEVDSMNDQPELPGIVFKERTGILELERSSAQIDTSVAVAQGTAQAQTDDEAADEKQPPSLTVKTSPGNNPRKRKSASLPHDLPSDTSLLTPAVT